MGGTDEKQNEYKSLRTRREPATAPAWALSWGIEMAKTENRKPKLGIWAQYYAHLRIKFYWESEDHENDLD